MIALVQALGIAYASGINLYLTVALLGLAERLHWIHPLPGELGALAQWWVIALAVAIYAVEFVATLVPGIASVWDTAHTIIRPAAAIVLATASVWGHDSPVVLSAALLGGGLALTTAGTKLGLRYAIDSSPEPFTNGAANLAELGFLSALVIGVWHHPVLALCAALVVLVLLLLLVRSLWRAVRRAFKRLGRSAPAAT